MCVFVCSKWDCGPQAFLADTMETGDITKAMHKNRKLRKMSTFTGTGWSTNSITWKSWLLWNKWLLQWSKKKNNFNVQNFDGQANWSGVWNFHCLQISFVMSTRFIFGNVGWLKWCAMFIALIPWFLCIYTRGSNQFRNKVENSTVDKVGSEKLLARKFCFT